LKTLLIFSVKTLSIFLSWNGVRGGEFDLFGVLDREPAKVIRRGVPVASRGVVGLVNRFLPLLRPEAGKTELRLQLLSDGRVSLAAEGIILNLGSSWADYCDYKLR
jgi:hypothetical protein